jgi:peptidoglycan/LPS O-acetylase OafA/YrhL
MKYRSEIDGLRALAVIPVILFHAGFELFAGGFVGVDVFFVISGYLITSILINDLENNAFSLIDFYERRARRILPALFFVMLICIPFAWLWMLPSQLIDFSQSLIAVSLFVSNFLFWKESNYFAPLAEEKPLLHTWSLAVEEQYYLLFPIFLFISWRLGKNKILLMIILLTFLSLIYSEWGWRNNPMANFYLAPARAWELFAGSITAFYIYKKGQRKNELLSIIGFAAVLVSIFIYDKTTPFPSIYSLVPVLGVVLLIIYGNENTFVGKFLSLKYIVGMGLISYSAYLWHQPIFAFAKIRFENVSSIAFIYLSIFAVMIASLSWKYIEQPFRNRNKFTQAKIFSTSLVFIALFISIGLIVQLYGNKFIPNYNLESKISPNFGLHSDCLIENDNVINNKCSTKTKAKYVLFGDSHAMHLADGFSENLKREFGLIQITKSGCAPLLNTAEYDHNINPCINFNKNAVEFIKNSTSIETVVISSRFGLLDKNASIWYENNEITSQNLKENIVKKEFIKLLTDIQNSGKKIVVVSTTPKPVDMFSPGQCVVKKLIKNKNPDDCNFYHTDRFINKGLLVFDSIKLNNLVKIDLISMICAENVCNSYQDEKILFSEGMHLSREGAKYLGDKYYWDILLKQEK